MNSKLNIYLADLAHDYLLTHLTVPLNIGFLKSYLLQEFSDQLEIRLFKSPAKLIDALNDEPHPHILGLSNYSWNEGLNRLIEQKLIAENSVTLLIQGGPHIRTDPNDIANYLKARPRVNYYAMLEGEWPLFHLVSRILSDEALLLNRKTDELIPGLAYLQDNELIYEPYISAKGDLDKIPSPYLTGVLDEFIKSDKYLPLIETNRGCPFACTFCAWGISALNKVRKFETDRVIAEIEYVVAISPATFWNFTDANFGMFERDVEIAEALRRVSEGSSLNRVGINWAKNSSRHCTKIAHILKNLCEPLVAVQSTDLQVLKNVKRSNIKMTTMTDLVEQGQKDGIPMTTDVLSCLPGESLDSHLETLRNVFRLGFEFFNVGPIRMLPGSEMESDVARNEFGLKTQYRLISGGYGRYDGTPVIEFEESVVASNAMSREDTFTIRLLHFFVWSMWNSGLAQPLLRWMQKAKGINPLDGLSTLIDDDSDESVRELIKCYRAESKTEWFNSSKELLEYWTENFDHLISNNFLKLNHKYLAKLLLNPELARRFLTIIARFADDSIANELVQFSLERVYLPFEKRIEKSMDCSKDLVDALALVYPKIANSGSRTCTFRIGTKRYDTFEYEYSKYDFEKNRELAMTQFLQIYGTDLLYDFSFDQGVERGVSRQAADSFDYEGQLREKRL